MPIFRPTLDIFYLPFSFSLPFSFFPFLWFQLCPLIFCWLETSHFLTGTILSILTGRLYSLFPTPLTHTLYDWNSNGFQTAEFHLVVYSLWCGWVFHTTWCNRLVGVYQFRLKTDTPVCAVELHYKYRSLSTTVVLRTIFCLRFNLLMVFWCRQSTHICFLILWFQDVFSSCSSFQI